MANADVLWLAVIGAAVWFWIDSLRARERAVQLCHASCRARGVQLLDQTVAVFGLGEQHPVLALARIDGEH